MDVWFPVLCGACAALLLYRFALQARRDVILDKCFCVYLRRAEAPRSFWLHQVYHLLLASVFLWQIALWYLGVYH